MMNKIWTGKDVKILRELYPKYSQKEVAQRMRLSVSQVTSAAQRYGIKSGRTGRFEKGRKAFNYGVKKLTSEKCLATAFKKGNLPYNTKRDGYISIRKDKCGKQYKYIRISLGKWELLHRHNWEKLFGPVPAGYIVVFKDGDTLNCDPSNLELITRAEHIQRNKNRSKAAESLSKLYRRERIRKIYGLPPASGLRVVNY